MKTLSENIYVSGQIQLADIEMLANAGMKTIINNRPDGEIPGQPESAKLRAEAQKFGLAYVELPMAAGLPDDLISGSVDAYKNSAKPIFAFCGSGTRSTVLWCFANVSVLGVDEVLTRASNAGYQLEQIRAPLTGFAAQG